MTVHVPPGVQSARIFDSTIILEYIEEKWPQPALLPRGPDERARARMIEDVMDTQYEAINWGIMEIARFRRASGNLRDTLLARAREQTGKLDIATRDGLKKYQQAEGLKVTGTLNKVTLEKMGIALTDKQKAM